MPAVENLFKAFNREQAFHRGTQCLVALLRWQLEHDSPASDLATVVKTACMAGVPIDPYSDEPLKMTEVNGQSVDLLRGGRRPGRQGLNRMGWQNATTQRRFDFPPAAAALSCFRETNYQNLDLPDRQVQCYREVGGRFKYGTLWLKKENGKVVTLPAEKLSDAY